MKFDLLTLLLAERFLVQRVVVINFLQLLLLLMMLYYKIQLCKYQQNQHPFSTEA